MLPKLSASIHSRTLVLVAFWAVVFLINVGPEEQKYGSIREILEVAGSRTLVQGLVALIALNLLVPHWLDRGRVVAFTVLALITLLLTAQVFILFSYFYLENAYPETYGAYYNRELADVSLTERLGFSYLIKYIMLSKVPRLAFPAAALIAVRYYRRQQAVLELREQKRAAELHALKNQLNPHFIFNTLNNIYALAIKRSDRTAEAVAKLSGILDYVLYRSDGRSVSLMQEAEMIEDYVALEKLRFGDRVEVTFDKHMQQPSRVSPLLLLTLLENAFKHGASQELDCAQIDIELSATADEVIFAVSNSKPKTQAHKQLSDANKPSNPTIGLTNLRRQLDLLYPNAHRLDIDETAHKFSVRLVLEGSPA